MVEVKQRQVEPTLDAALATAVAMLRAANMDYRNPHGEKARWMDKRTRARMAAELADFIRLIEDHRSKLSQGR